jgi:hypothetical protein
LALRLSTIGRNVLDGIGLAVSDGRGVSVKVLVGVTEAVCVAVGARGVTVSVIGENAVFVGTLVSTNVGGMGVDVKVQANEVTIHKIKKIRFRRIC